MKKLITFVLAFILVLCAIEMPVQAAWLKSGNNWYYTDSAGKPVTGWLKEGNTWYYMDRSGVMQTGWVNIGNVWYYMNASGAMQTGWLQLGSNWYYLSASGAMVTGIISINRNLHQFNASGLWLGAVPQNGWVKDGNNWYYYQRGIKATGWIKSGSTWYYMNSSGVMHIGWLQLGNTWYYMNGSGAMVTGTVSIGSKQHRFNASGAWLGEVQQTGWVKAGNDWYYYKNGSKATGWLQLGSTWYYMNAAGVMQTGWVNIGDTRYYLRSNGAMQVGWVNVDNAWYFMAASGAMQTGWLDMGGEKYYLRASGEMLVGWQTIDGNTYYFYTAGAMAANTVIDDIPIGADGKAQQNEAVPDDAEDPAAPPESATITIGIPQIGTFNDYENNELTLWLEEQTGYQIEIVCYSDPYYDFSQDIANQKPLPDILLGFQLNAETVSLYGNTGYLTDLTPYFRDTDGASAVFWERLNACLTQHEINQVMQKIYNREAEGIYSVPTITTDAFNTDCVAWINTQWLSALNLEMPTNTEELYQVLKAFKTQDPNGNGIADEIPLLGAENVPGFKTTQWLINMYLYYDNSNLWQPDANGQLQSVFTQESYRDALKFIHTLVDEGLLGVHSYTNNLSQMDSILSASTPCVGAMVCNMPQLVQRGIPIETLNMYSPIENWGHTVKNDLNCKTDTFISGNCSDVAAAFRVLMMLYSEEGSLRMRYGVPGEDWTNERVYGDSLDGVAANIAILNEMPDTADQTWWGFQACGIMDYAGGAARVYEHAGDEDCWLFQNIMCAAKFLIWGEYNEPENFCRGLTDSAFLDAKTRVQDYVLRATTDFSTGQSDPYDDGAWDAYLAKLEELELPDLTAAMQTLYDSRTVCTHLFANATCVQAQMCIYCGALQGQPKGHAYSGGACSLCNRVTPTLTNNNWCGLFINEQQYGKPCFTFNADNSCSINIPYYDIITGISSDLVRNSSWSLVDGKLCFSVPSGTWRTGTYEVSGDTVIMNFYGNIIKIERQSADSFIVTYADNFVPVGMILTPEK